MSEVDTPASGARFSASTVRAAPPSGLVVFCARQPDLCGLDGQERLLAREAALRPLTLTPMIWRLLRDVNAEVNWRIAPRSDEDVYGARERWAMPLSRPEQGARGRGDCEDYVLEKRARLIDAGLPEEVLQIAVGVAPEAGRHTVLIVRTDRGDLVLDNRTRVIGRVDQTPYHWLSRQDGQTLLNWVAINEAAFERDAAALMLAGGDDIEPPAAGGRVFAALVAHRAAQLSGFSD